jgi:hypothetical protein
VGVLVNGIKGDFHEQAATNNAWIIEAPGEALVDSIVPLSQYIDAAEYTAGADLTDNNATIEITITGTGNDALDGEDLVYTLIWDDGLTIVCGTDDIGTAEYSSLPNECRQTVSASTT